MRSLRLAGAALTAVALLATAAPAAAAPSTAIVSGRVLDTAGKPVRGAYVTYTKKFVEEPRSWVDALACAFTLFLACVTLPDTTPTTATARTDAAGRYRLKVRLDWRVGRTGDHDLTFVAPSGSPRATTRTVHHFGGRSTKLRDFRLWGKPAALDPVTPTHRRLHVDPLPPSFGVAKRRPDAVLLQGTRYVHVFGEVASDRLVDTRQVETGVSGILATTEAELGGYDVEYRSAVRALTGQVRPVSRGRPCYAYGAKDKRLKLSGCRLTDGRLADAVPAKHKTANGAACRSRTRCAHPGWLLVDLGEPTLVNALVLRRCTADFSGLSLSDGAAVETSPDGTVYLPFHGLEPLRDGVLVGEPALARYVRVDVSGCDDVTEVAVFAPVA